VEGSWTRLQLPLPVLTGIRLVLRPPLPGGRGLVIRRDLRCLERCDSWAGRRCAGVVFASDGLCRMMTHVPLPLVIVTW